MTRLQPRRAPARPETSSPPTGRRRSGSRRSRSATARPWRVDGLDFDGRAGRGVRPARSERRRQDHDGRDPRGLPHARRGHGVACSVSTRSPTARALRPRIGVMLQEGGLYPGLRPLELLQLFAAYYDDPADPDALLDLVGLRDSVGTYGAPAVGRSGAAAVARVRARRPARGRVPRRADRGHGPARPRDDLAARPRPARRGARRSCSPPTRWTRPSSSATGSRSSPAARLAAIGSPAELTASAR